MTRQGLYLAGVRTKTHVHADPTERCDKCLMDLLELGRYGFAMLNKINELEEDNKRLNEEIVEKDKELTYWSNK